MGIFDSFGGAKEKARLESLKRLEDKRMAFAREVDGMGIRMEQSLFAQRGGGFIGIGIAGGDKYLLTGPAPGEEEGQFQIENLGDAAMHFEPHIIPSEGGGGMMGFGKKGGRGYKLVISRPDAERIEAEFVPALQGILDVEGAPSALLSLNRRRKDANFVWDFKPIRTQDMDAIVQRWTKLLGAEM